jgi:PHP family Zn ribbon phosphoesterase
MGDIFRVNGTLERAIGSLQSDEIEEIAATFEGLDEDLSEASKPRKGKGMLIHCNECGHQFRKKIGPKTYEIKCPKCGGYDTEPAAYFGHATR